MKEVGVGLEKDSFQIMPEGTTEVVAVDLDQVQELVLTEIGLDVISVESMISLLKTVHLTSKTVKETGQIQWMYNMDKEQTSLKTLVTDTYDSLN